MQQVYLIFITKIPDIRLDLVVKITFKVINNLLSLNKLVFSLLVFDLYSRMIKLDVLFLSINQHIITIKKVIIKG